MSIQPLSSLPPVDRLVKQDEAASSQALRDAKVMIVDDEPILIDVLQILLEDAGYTNLLTLDEPTRALDMLLNRRPDVLLLDLIMPKKSGFELLRDIRNDPMLRYMPVIVLTAASDPDTKLQALELGATEFLSKPVDSSELVLRLRNALAFKAYQDQLAYYDALTGLPNRQLFMERLDWTLRLAHRHNKQCALLQIGLDRFKQVNDSLGHQKGDEVLVAVSRRLSQSLREANALGMSDAGEEAVSISRLAGDEFMVLISEINHTETVATIARRLLDSMKMPLLLGGQELFISISVGISLFPHDSDKASDLLTRVDLAMAQAKLNGRNTYAFYSPEANARSFERLQLETALRRAIDKKELVVHYQPKVDLATGDIVGAEALSRWTHESLGDVSPARFIPLAEETGLILPLGELVLRQACMDAATWQSAGRELPVSVNVSSLQFLRSDMPLVIQSALQASGLAPGSLIIELTESLLMDDAQASSDMLCSIKSLGVRLSMDDFGTGYSSLTYLKQFPLHELKIDRSFVRDLPGDSGSAAIVGAVIAMAHGLGLTVTAEGVEVVDQLDFLKAHGCDQFQGFLFSRAVPFPQFIELLAHTRPCMPDPDQLVTHLRDLP